jgi:hypothetical protein
MGDGSAELAAVRRALEAFHTAVGMLRSPGPARAVTTR